MEELKIIKEIVEAVPIYEDVIQPPARRVGKALEDITKVAATPFTLLGKGYDLVSGRLEEVFSERKIDEQNIIPVKQSIAGPALSTVAYLEEEPELKEMFARLIATAADRENSHKAHPSFVDMIKNMSANDAKCISHFYINSGYKKNQGFDAYPIISLKAYTTSPYNGNYNFDYEFKAYSPLPYKAGCSLSVTESCALTWNLDRLGLIEVMLERAIDNDEIYKNLCNYPLIREWVKDKLPNSYDFQCGVIEITELGKMFGDACIA